ncbi:hypothetical protein Kpho02_41770 [Kitasatospora phosalacinea]|uniref:TerD domain-containing protein n=1 Tax=Kitasatospora phosalacinea TaxID=2065 RepID=A0A9W6QBA4_9ACTN|nr:TerD family protein [Kitasatospora phosalacinea]GLW71878.1 hypothetical protein Kpho02_41770 [Kitasatospora phosalacinea]
MSTRGIRASAGPRIAGVGVGSGGARLAAVLSRLPGTRRLGCVAFGRWTRPAIAAGPRRTPEDALRLLDLGQDVACSVTTTPSGNPSTTLRPLPTDRIPGLRHLLDLLQEDEEADGAPDPLPPATLDATLAEPVPTVDRHLESPCRTRPFAVCRLDTAPDPPTAVTDRLRLQFLAGGADADLALLLLDADSRVSGDFDPVFHRQPVGAAGAVRTHGELREGDRRAERADVDLRALPDRVRRILIAVGTDAHGGVPLADLHEPLLTLRAPGTGAWRIAVTPDPRAGAETVAELVRETAPDSHRWGVRTIARPWTGGLTALVRAYGIDAD